MHDSSVCYWSLYVENEKSNATVRLEKLNVFQPGIQDRCGLERQIRFCSDYVSANMFVLWTVHKFSVQQKLQIVCRQSALAGDVISCRLPASITCALNLHLQNDLRYIQQNPPHFDFLQICKFLYLLPLQISRCAPDWIFDILGNKTALIWSETDVTRTVFIVLRPLPPPPHLPHLPRLTPR